MFFYAYKSVRFHKIFISGKMMLPSPWCCLAKTTAVKVLAAATSGISSSLFL